MNTRRRSAFNAAKAGRQRVEGAEGSEPGVSVILSPSTLRHAIKTTKRGEEEEDEEGPTRVVGRWRGARVRRAGSHQTVLKGVLVTQPRRVICPRLNNCSVCTPRVGTAAEWRQVDRVTPRGAAGAARGGVNDFPAGPVRRWAERMCPLTGTEPPSQKLMIFSSP